MNLLILQKSREIGLVKNFKVYLKLNNFFSLTLKEFPSPVVPKKTTPSSPSFNKFIPCSVVSETSRERSFLKAVREAANAPLILFFEDDDAILIIP